MKLPPVKVRLAIVGAVVIIAAVAGLSLRGEAEDAVLSGYVEGERVYLAAPVSGAMVELSVQEGERVAAGAPTFLIDPSVQQAQANGAAAAAQAAAARAEDLRRGQRAQELDVIDAELAAALAQLREAEASYARVEPLVRRGVYAPARLDQERAARDTARAQVAAVRRRREVATLGAREGAVAAADQQTVQARSAVGEAQARLRTLAPRAPAAALVEEVFFRPGEYVTANQPVLALLPDGEVKLRFFVPATEIALYRPGVAVAFSCDSCGAPRRAVIRWVSPRPEFTPPMLYGRSSRERLVFMVEAAPHDPRTLTPGMPVDVRRLERAP